MQNEHYLPSGTSLQNGKYHITDILGQGGFGITYKAYFEQLKAYVAVKEFFLSGKCVRNTGQQTVTPQAIEPAKFYEFKQKFLEEARLIYTLRHPNIVRVSDVFEENNTAYYVMEYIEGETLKSKILNKGKLPESEAIDYITQVAAAVNELHERNFIHRDIKPENIIITPNKKAILLDFGIARWFAEDHTVTQSVMLSVGFAPPEQYSLRMKRGRYSDIYGLGATLYAAVTGQMPIAANDRTDADNPGHDFLIPPLKHNSALSVHTNDAILRAMSLSTKQRQQTTDEFIQSLKIQATNTFIATVIEDKTVIENEQKTIIADSAKTEVPPTKVESKPQNNNLIYAVVASILLLIILSVYVEQNDAAFAGACVLLILIFWWMFGKKKSDVSKTSGF